MTIDQLWHELEAEAATGGSATWLTRFARPQPGYPLLVALEQATNSRALLLPVPKVMSPPRREWPECRGLELLLVAVGTETYLRVRLRDPICADVFTALVEDVAPRVAAANGPKEAASELLGRLRRWQHFLTAGLERLTLEAQRGLWGELHVLRAHLMPTLGPAATVSGWKASAATHQDFQFSAGAVEVKTTTAKQPQSVRITSERQLDDTGVGTLFLHIAVVDEREVTPGSNVPGQSLPILIAGVRAQLANDVIALTTFNDRLLDRGWLDASSNRYEGHRWTIRAEHTFHIRRGFPRLVESDLAMGVGDVNYAVSLAACAPFVTNITAVVATLSAPVPSGAQNNKQ